MQVAAQTQHQVTLVDVSEDILTKAGERIKTSLSRVAKKKFGEDPKVRKWNIGWECGYMEVILLVTLLLLLIEFFFLSFFFKGVSAS